MRYGNVEIRAGEKRRLYTKYTLNANAQARSKRTRFLNNTAFEKIRQAKLITVPSEDQLLNRMDSGVYGLIALITTIIYLSSDLRTLLFTVEQHEQYTLSLSSKYTTIYK
jgi:hypothetical protein